MGKSPPASLSRPFLRVISSQSPICMRQGAAEIVLRSCTKVVRADGSAIPLVSDMRTELEEATTDMASRGLRTLCMTYRDFPANVERPADYFETPPDSELTCCAITGIKASCCLAGHLARSEHDSLAVKRLLLQGQLRAALCCCATPAVTTMFVISAAWAHGLNEPNWNAIEPKTCHM